MRTCREHLRGHKISDRAHRFGGSWTEDKLDRVRKYLDAYTTALKYKPSKHKPFKLLYVDAFAGTGYRVDKDDCETIGGLFDFPGIDDLAKGSPRIALEIDNRPFDEFIFIEKEPTRFKALEALRDEFPARAEQMHFINDDANAAVARLCRETDWRGTRAVMFLDPKGMQVDWTTIEAVAATRAIDLWYLCPAGMGPGRLVTRDGNMPRKWQELHDRIFGEEEWRDWFYREVSEPDLFEGLITKSEKTTSPERIEAYLLQRLRSAFVGVANRTAHLKNSKTTMYLLAFACSNERGKSTALRIANHILKD